MTTPPEVPPPITYGCLHCPLAAASVRARSAGFWNEARPQRPTISSARIEAGISGATPGSTGSGDEFEDSEGRLMLPQPPRKTVSAEAIARLATVRALTDLIIALPRPILSRPSRSQPQNACRSNDVPLTTPSFRFGFSPSILYWPHQGLNRFRILPHLG